MTSAFNPMFVALESSIFGDCEPKKFPISHVENSALRQKQFEELKQGRAQKWTCWPLLKKRLDPFVF